MIYEISSTDENKKFVVTNTEAKAEASEGRPTEVGRKARVESKRVDEFANMSDEELRQYVYGNKESDR